MPLLAVTIAAASLALPPVRVHAKVSIPAAPQVAGGELTLAPSAQACVQALGGRVVGAAGVGRAVDPAAHAIGLDRWLLIELPNGTESIGAAAMIAGSWEGFELVEPDGQGTLADLPNDPSFSAQWALRNTGQTGGVPGADIRAEAAWSAARTANLTIGVLDGGVDPVADLGNRILPGFNVPQQSNATFDTCGGHGTHVCGIIAAGGNNATAIAGVCWDAKVLPVVVVDPCTFYESWVAEGLVWAIDHGADVVNMSLQSNPGTQVLLDAVLYGEALGVPMVAATGNSNQPQPAFPARWPQTIAVGASTAMDERWGSSNYGSETDLVAPGENVLSLTTTGGTISRSGTSMATPHVTGTVALMLSVFPEMTNAQVLAALRATAHDLSPTGTDEFTGAGRLDAGAAVAAAAAMGPPAADLDGDGDVDGADLGVLLSGWGPCGLCSECAGDVNHDCIVDGADLGLLLSTWSAS